MTRRLTLAALRSIRETTRSACVVLVPLLALGCGPAPSPYDCDAPWTAIAPVPGGLLVDCDPPDPAAWVRPTSDGLVVLGLGCSGARYHLTEDRWSALPAIEGTRIGPNTQVVVAGDHLVVARERALPDYEVVVSLLDLREPEPRWVDLDIGRIGYPTAASWTGTEVLIIHEWATPGGPVHEGFALDPTTLEVRRLPDLTIGPADHFTARDIAVVGRTLIAFGRGPGPADVVRLRDLDTGEVRELAIPPASSARLGAAPREVELTTASRRLSGPLVGAPLWEVLDPVTETWAVHPALDLEWRGPLYGFGMSGPELRGATAVVGDRVLASLPDAPVMVSVVTWETWSLRPAVVGGEPISGPSIAVGDAVVIFAPQSGRGGARLDLCGP